MAGRARRRAYPSAAETRAAPSGAEAPKATADPLVKPAHASEPPPGSPWDDPIDEAALVFVDLEMTGLRPEVDRVIEICAERVRGEREEAQVTSLVRPDSDAFGNAHIHGIAATDLASAPSFAELAGATLRVLEGAVLVAHSAPWDVAFLEAELERAGHPFRIEHYLDTLSLSRRAFALPSHRLSALCEALGIRQERAHRAGDDVRALRAVWRRVIEVLAPRTPRDLWHVRVGERHARPDVVAAAVRALEAQVDVTVRHRPAHRAAEDLTMRITSVRTDLDPPRVLGYLLPSRSRRELRADRILAIEAAPQPPPPPPKQRLAR
jgi:DNA polymerase-3 subunit epsilon